MSESNIQHFLHFIINWSLWGAPQSPILGGTVPLTPKKEANRVTTSSFGDLTRRKSATKHENKVILHSLSLEESLKYNL